MAPQYSPFTITVLQPVSAKSATPGVSSYKTSNPAGKDSAFSDDLPASYQEDHQHLGVPSDDIDGFLEKELSLRKLEQFLKHLWFVGAEHVAGPLNWQISIGREITVTEEMDLHLIWANTGKIFIKPMPRFLLNPDFWRECLSCQTICECETTEAREANTLPPPVSQSNGVSRNEAGSSTESPTDHSSKKCSRMRLRMCALGFLYTYICLISHESDFIIANERHLLPQLECGRTILWRDWKKLVAEVLAGYDRDNVHPRFHRAELRLSRLNIIHRFTQFPPFVSYLPDWRNYGSMIRDNLTWLATATVFIALVLTAMQVGLANDRLKQNKKFVNASYGFTIFALLTPLCAFGLVTLQALYNLAKDMPSLIRNNTRRRIPARTSGGFGQDVSPRL